MYGVGDRTALAIWKVQMSIRYGKGCGTGRDRDRKLSSFVTIGIREHTTSLSYIIN